MSPPRTMPWRARCSASTAGSRADSAASARPVRSSPAWSTSSQPSICATHRRNSSARTSRRVMARMSSKPCAPARRLARVRAGSLAVGTSRPSSAAGTRARWSARDGAAPSTAAMRPSSAGLRRTMDSSGTPAGRRDSSASSRLNAASGSACADSSRSRDGSTASISSRDRAERRARSRPACQPRKVATMPGMLRKPMPSSAATVSGGSSMPLRSRVGAAAGRSGTASNTSA